MPLRLKASMPWSPVSTAVMLDTSFPVGISTMDEYEPKLMGWFGPTMGDYSMELIRHLTDIVGK